ncbi:MAG TPA: hypothetical protein VE173_06550, partial [Longimicrobiales bacterium]|nr:hypothetical protein [Longimicrobiales bacterium]
MVLVSGVLLGTGFSWLGQPDEAQMVVTAICFVVTVLVTGASFHHTHVRGRVPGENFLYSQVLLDVLLTTAIVDMTG